MIHEGTVVEPSVIKSTVQTSESTEKLSALITYAEIFYGCIWRFSSRGEESSRKHSVMYLICVHSVRLVVKYPSDKPYSEC